MTITDKYWWKINKKSCIISFIFVFLFTVCIQLTGLGVLIAIIITVSSATRYLNLGTATYNENDSLNQILIMPFSREQIYKSFIKNMFIQALVTVILLFIGNLIETTFLIKYSSLKVGDIEIYSRIFVWMSFFKQIAFILFILVCLVGIINRYTSQRKSFLLIVICGLGFSSVIVDIFFDLIAIAIANYLAITIAQFQLMVMIIYLLACIILILIYIKQIETNYHKFVLQKYRTSYGKWLPLGE